jgi:hypothetical protein
LLTKTEIEAETQASTPADLDSSILSINIRRNTSEDGELLVDPEEIDR